MPETWFADRPASVKFPVVTRANAGEVMSDPVSPATVSFGMMNAGEKGWRDAYVSGGTMNAEEFESDRLNTIAYYGGYLFLNMSITRIFGARCPGMTPELVDVQYFGTMPGIPDYVAEPWHTNEDNTARLGAWIQSGFTHDDLPEARMDAVCVQAIVDGRPDLDALTDRELLARVRSMTYEYRGLFERHILTSAGAGIGIATVAQVCAAVGKPELTLSVIGGAGDVDSAAPSWVMWELSRLVRGSVALTAMFDSGVSGLGAQLHASDHADAVAFRAGLTKFMQQFGCRGPNEWELRSLTWDLKPELVFAAVERMRLMPDADAPQHNHERLGREREAAAAQIRMLVATDPVAGATFEAGMRMAMLYAAGRERTKTNNIKIVHEQRLPLRELGRRMVERGHLDNIEQVFMLLDEGVTTEFEQFIADPAAWTTVLRERERDYLELFDLEPPFVIGGPPPPLSEWTKRGSRQVATVEPGTVLTGIAGCPGTYTGRARIILDPGDPLALEPGDILVAPNTDPAWTPLFVPAGAVVVDVGAQITHAVIVSRELGIPCVVSVTDATKKISDGAMITVDGTAGTVTVH
jgi:rifampicin phosphotransferase